MRHDSITEVLRQRLSLRSGTDVDGTVRRVSQGASLTTENLWLLVCSAILASIGLDTSSAAVIIGAMLISPLMGPILGVGLGMGVTDRHLLQRSLRELLISTAISLAASTVYFVASPLASATPELIARTRPTLLDVGVAFFGGLAGIIAGSRRDLSLALPGVAIATALMPPLCTAGFGLATGNWAFLLGALYLYALNAVFIALSTFLLVRLLRFPHHVEATPRARQLEHRVVAVVAIVAALPSMFFLYDTARRVRETTRISSFVRREVVRPGRAVPQWEHKHDVRGDTLRVYVAGHPVEAAGVESLRAVLPRYGLDRMRLELIQGDVSTDDLKRLEGDVQRGILRAIAAANAARDTALATRARSESVERTDLARQVASAFPEIQAIAYAQDLNLLAGTPAAGGPALLLTFAPRVSPTRRREVLRRVDALVRARWRSDSLSVVER